MAGRPLSGRPLLTPSQVKGRSSLPSDEDAACRRAMVAFFTCLDHSNGSKGCIDRAVASCVWRELTRDLDSTQVRSLEQQLQSRADPILCEEWLSLMGKLCSIGGKRLFMSGVLRAWVLVEEGRLKVDTPKRERRRARSLALLEIKPKKLEPLLSKGDRVVTKQEDVNSMSSTVSDEALVVDTDQASCGVEGDVSPVFRNCASPSKRKNLKGGLKKEVLLENPCMVKSASCSMLEGPLVADGHNVPTRAALTCFSFVPTTTHQSGLDTCAVPKRASKLHSSLDKGKTSLSCNLLADVTSSKANASSQMDACLITSAAEAHARPGKAQSQVALVREQLSGNVANAAIWKDVSLTEKNTWDVDLATSSCQAPSGSVGKRDAADIEKRLHDGVELESRFKEEAPLTDPSLDCKLGRVSATAFIELAERNHESSSDNRHEISTALDLVEQKHTSTDGIGNVESLKSGLKKDVLVENPPISKSGSCSVLEGALAADVNNVPTSAALTRFSFVPTSTYQSGLDKCVVPKRASKLHSSLDKGKTSLSCTLLADVTSSKANASSQMDACSVTLAAEAHARPGKTKSPNCVALVETQLSGKVANAAIWKDVSLAEKNTWDVDLATSSCQAPSGSAMKRDVADIEKRPHDGVERDSQCRDEAPLTDPSLDCKLGRVSATVDLVERDHESSGATRDEISTALDLVEQNPTSINEKQHLSNYVHPLKSGDCELPALQKAYAPEACENVACDSSTKLQNCEDSINYWPSSGCSLVAIPRDASLIDDMHSFGGDVQMTKEEGLGNTDQATMEQQQQDYYISTEVSASRDNRESSPHRNERARNCCSPIHKQKHNARPETSEAKSYATHARKILSPSHTRQIGSQPLIPAAFRRQPLPPLPKVPIAVPWAVRMAKSVAEWKANHFNYFRVGNVIKSTKDFSIGGNEIHNGHIGRITCISPEVSMSVLLDECNNAIIVPKKDWSNFDLQVVTHEVDLIDNLGNVTGKCLPCIALKQHHGGFFDILCQDGREACFVHNTFLKELSFGMFTDVGFSSARTSPSSAPLDREVHLVARSSDDTKHLPNNCESMCFELPPAGFQGSTALASSPLLPVRMKDCAAKRREEPRREVSSHIPTRGVGDACEVGGQICPFMEIGDEGLRAITSLMNFSVEDVVVDIGCGHGKILNMILQRFPCQGIGVEINSSIARVAEHQLQRYAGRANVVVDDIRNVDLHRATATVSFMLTHSFEVQGMSLREHMSKSLQPGCIVINYCYPVPGWHGSYQNGVWKYIIGEHLCAK